MSENTKTATERLSDLENTQGQIIQAIQPLEPMARELAGIKEALMLLNNKLDATIKSINASGTQVTDEQVSKFMVENNVRDLQGKVTQMVNNGLLAASDTVSKDSFVVINEADASGQIVNPRMQFLVSALQHEEVRSKLEGAKVGSNVSVGTEGASINVLEAYDVVTPQAPAAEAAPAAPEATLPDTSVSDAEIVSEAAPATEASA